MIYFSNKHLLFLICFLFLVNGSLFTYAQQTECPRIYKVGDTLKTDQAPAYQWYKNGISIPNAVQNWYHPDTSGNYTVAVGGTSSPAKNVVLNPTDLRVEVFDAKLKPVAHAAVSVNGINTTTNAEGKAFIPNVVSGRTVVKVTAYGYFDGYTSTYKPANGDALVKIQLEQMPAPLTVIAENGGGVASSTGLNITFKPNSFINESTGALHSGEVKVYFNHRAPENDPMFSFAMPGGDFTAINQNGETVALTSYGFFNAELRGENGEELNLRPGTTAEVQFRIPKSMRANSPTTVPLWYFDETAGIWKYDSELTKSSMFYKGQVSHFSTWNCDYYGANCTVVASAVDCAGNPIANTMFCLNQRCGFTDVNGNITFVNAPADLPITLATMQQTINIGIVGENNTYILSEPLLAGKTMLAFVEYWKDSVEVHTWGAEAPIYYSLDSINWQAESLFTNVPFQDSVTVWIKDTTDCPIQRFAYYTRVRIPYFCSPPQDQSQVNQYSFYYNNLPNGNVPVYNIIGCPTDSNQLTDVCAQYSCLAKLYIGSCNLTFLPAEIGNLSNLQALNLQYNQLSYLPAEIGNLSKLQQLWLNQNQFSTFPTQIGSLSNLQILHLSGNQLISLPLEISSLSSLQTLYLENNQLISLPSEIGSLSSLQRLSLRENQLISLPSEIGSLSSLLTLYLEKNQLSALPMEIGNLNILQELWLGENKLSSLPAEIGNLSNLRMLNLSANKLSSLPSEIGNLSKLEEIWLSANKLNSLPREIGNLSNLKSLNLGSNKLTSLPAEIGNLADTLTELLLGGNPIPVQDRAYYQSLLPNTTIIWE